MKTHSCISLLLSCLSLAIGATALTGCGGSDDNVATTADSFSCSTKGPCAGDPVPSADQTAACVELSADGTCGPAFEAYSACAYSAARCGDSSLSDPDADSTSTACVAEYATYTTCLGNKKVDAGSATP
jgi:hypothetical protein